MARRTESEAEQIRSSFPKADIVIAQDIPVGQKMELDDILNRKKTGNIRFVFISRVGSKERPASSHSMPQRMQDRGKRSI